MKYGGRELSEYREAFQGKVRYMGKREEGKG